MADETPTKRERKSRVARGRLRRQQQVEHVMIDETFSFQNPTYTAGDDRMAGEGAYVTATVHSRRYYGVLVDQAALKAASLLFFQEEARGLDLNRRIHSLRKQQEQLAPNEARDEADRKRPSNTCNDDGDEGRKRPRFEPTPTNVHSDAAAVLRNTTAMARQVQKFRYVAPSNGNKKMDGYRILLATFADIDAAAEDDMDKKHQIEVACRAGGNFVGDYYYQYEVPEMALEASVPDNTEAAGMRMSLEFQSFLRNTILPPWYPLSNLQVDQQKFLSLLSMKKDNRGNVVFDSESVQKAEVSLNGLNESLIPIEPRSAYRIVIVGGGIGGLMTALEIFRQCERENIEVEVTLLEGRSRLGGRLWTDTQTFKGCDGSTTFPVDLGASWIHGIDQNPLAALARESGLDFVKTSEDVKMLQAGRQEVDPEKDQQSGEFFDKILDIATENTWRADEEGVKSVANGQLAVRWYASVLGSHEKRELRPKAVDVPDHRRSADVSVDRALGKAIAQHALAEFQLLSGIERRMLFWNLKNVEYALGANLSDLSMKFWDIDERHAFEGDHVILRQGYSFVVEHLLKQLQRQGDRFHYHLDFPVGKIEYSRKTRSLSYIGASRRQRSLDLSDTCCVTSRDGKRSCPGDMVVCAVPLGVLKESLNDCLEVTDSRNKIEFDPPLPLSKRDAIQSVGFGLLDKVYLQFSVAFWREETKDNTVIFGNASGVNPHHYMFFDVGKTLGQGDNKPAILMTLISGNEAVDCERLTPRELVAEVLKTLRTIFSDADVPEPMAFRTTKWGTDEFSRGSYTFLPPGCTDSDFVSLQSPVNGNGDSLLLDGSETMRLFFAGEHTTALHPSMAHGAMLSGIRAAEEVVSALSLSSKMDDTFDRLIPMSLFRFMHPDVALECNFCHVSGSRAYEGPLLAFKRGSRQVLAHNCCAEYSPEVEVVDGHWRHVMKAVNRSASVECIVCGEMGASIGCNNEDCWQNYHFKCAERHAGWRFEQDGKEFYCRDHRLMDDLEQPRPDTTESGFQHALFSVPLGPTQDTAGIADASNTTAIAEEESAVLARELDTARLTDQVDLECPVDTLLVRIRRPSLRDLWNLELAGTPNVDGDYTLSVARGPPGDSCDCLLEGDIVLAMNGVRLGSDELNTVDKFVARLGQEVEVLVEVQRVVR